MELVAGGRVQVGIAQQRAGRRESPHPQQHRVARPGPDVVAIGRDERVTFLLRQAEPGGLQCGDEVDLTRAGAHVVPVGQDDPDKSRRAQSAAAG